MTTNSRIGWIATALVASGLWAQAAAAAPPDAVDRYLANDRAHRAAVAAVEQPDAIDRRLAAERRWSATTTAPDAVNRYLANDRAHGLPVASPTVAARAIAAPGSGFAWGVLGMGVGLGLALAILAAAARKAVLPSRHA